MENDEDDDHEEDDSDYSPKGGAMDLKKKKS